MLEKTWLVVMMILVVKVWLSVKKCRLVVMMMLIVMT